MENAVTERGPIQCNRQMRWTAHGFCLGLLMAAILTFWSSPSQAQGTHFIAEGEFGTSIPIGIDTDRPGWALGVTGGVGGVIPDTIIRLYGIGEFTYSSFSVLRSESELGLSRNSTELAMGGRMLVPLFSWLRVFADGLIGVSWLESEEFDLKGERFFEVDVDPRWSMFFGAGIQLRPAEFISVGLKGNLGVLLDTEGLPEEDADGRMNFMGTATFHF